MQYSSNFQKEINLSLNLQNNKQQIKNNLNSNTMIKQAFTSYFKKHIWYQISKIPSFIFIQQQNLIFNYLLENQDDFQTYFPKFYTNHTYLYQWYALATEKHQEIKDYILFPLLKKTFKQHKQSMKSIVNLKKYPNKSTKKLILSIFCCRSISQSQKKPFLTNNQSKQVVQPKKLLKKASETNLESQIKKDQDQDYHELFVNTLEACSGKKFIHYNFIKHQQGFEQRIKYNNFIRLSKNPTIDQKHSITEQNKMLRTFNGPFRQLQNRSYDNFPKNIASTFTDSFRFQKINNAKSENAQKNYKYNSFQLTPIGSIHQKPCKSKMVEVGKRNLVVKKLPNRFGKQKVSLFDFNNSIVLDLEAPLLR